jgi:hypothetical protein
MKRLRNVSTLAVASGLLLVLVGCSAHSTAAYSVSAALLGHRAIMPSEALTNSLPAGYQDHVVGSFALPGAVQGVVAITPAGCAVGTLVGRSASSVSVAFPTRESYPVAAVPQLVGGSQLGRAAAVGMRNATVSVTMYCGLDGVGVVVHEPDTGLSVTGAVHQTGAPGESNETALRVTALGVTALRVSG